MMKKHGVLIGGTRGIGRALVKILSQEGYVLSVIGLRSPFETDRQLAGIDYWAEDVTNWKRFSATLSEIIQKKGKPHSLIFLQRYRGQGDRWTGEMETSLTSTKNVIEALSDQMEAGQGGSIVVVSSVIGRFIDTKQPISYHVAKAALQQMVRYYAFALGPRGIRVNGVSPSTILKEESKEAYLKNEQLHALYRQIIPLRRMGTAEEVAQVIAFLCSPKASFVTGQDIVVDGGLSLQWQETLALELSSNKSLEKVPIR